MAKLEITCENREFREQWDQFVLNHPLGSFFHLYNWLEIVQWKTGFAFKPLIIRTDGGDVCGIMPVFIKKYAGITLCMSPPPKVSTPWMGLLPVFSSDKQYNIEKQSQKIIEAVHVFLRDQLHADFIRLICVSGFDDIRPFKWLGYQCSPAYTYFLDITDNAKAFEKFDGRIRTGIRKARKNNLIYKHADNTMAPTVIDAVTERYERQGLSFALDRELLHRLLKSNAGTFIETTSVLDEEGFVTGNILIKYKKQVHHWIGGVHPYRNHQGANELLHWSAIEKYSDQGIGYYEFMGANTKHLCDHKSKYNPKLRVFYSCEWKNNKGTLIDWAQILMRKRKRG
ncbi:GNAT family N-acetyltransferase [Desulfobacter hydrogenophilus]|nr:GNAT family N-acetyltransferase [Desulfobacter hydrogenophilus]NDY74105.1 GNAT family N-acetyltransferase [Desulfobacter hydrogenophilus]